jgi:hypothetical protein
VNVIGVLSGEIGTKILSAAELTRHPPGRLSGEMSRALFKVEAPLLGSESTGKGRRTLPPASPATRQSWWGGSVSNSRMFRRSLDPDEGTVSNPIWVVPEFRESM